MIETRRFLKPFFKQLAEDFISAHTNPEPTIENNIIIPESLINPADERIMPTHHTVESINLNPLRTFFTQGHPSELPPVELLMVDAGAIRKLVALSRITIPSVINFFKADHGDHILLILDGSHRLTAAYEKGLSIFAVIIPLSEALRANHVLVERVGRTFDIELNKDLIELAINMFLGTLTDEIFSVKDLATKGVRNWD